MKQKRKTLAKDGT